MVIKEINQNNDSPVILPIEALPIHAEALTQASEKSGNRSTMRMVKHAMIAQPNIQPLDVQLKTGYLQKALLSNEIKANDLLHQAILENATVVVQFLVEHGVDINSPNSNGNTPLIVAIERNAISIVEILIKAKANLEIRRKQDSFSPLEIAIAMNSPIADQLLNAGANPNSGRPGATGLLAQAISKQNSNLVNLLIQKGAEVNVGDTKISNPLYQAFLAPESFRTQIIGQLLQKGVDSNRMLENQMTVLSHIVERASTQPSPTDINLIKQICAKGADVHAKSGSGRSALEIAIASGRNDILTVLNEYRKDILYLNEQLNLAVQSKQTVLVQKWLSKGADINNKDLNGQTNLYRVFMQGDHTFAQVLVDKGANIAQSNLPSLPEIIEKQIFQGPALLAMSDFYLRNRTVSPDALDQFGRPLISIAVMVGNLDLVQLLINHKANVEPAQKINGKSPLLLALQFNNAQIAKLLIENGANINAIYEGKSVLMNVLDRTMSILVPLLLERGVQLNTGINHSNNPLAYAINAGNFNLMKDLIAKGADVNYVLSDAKQTALFIAINRNRTNCVEYLLQNGARHDVKDCWSHSPMWYAIQVGAQESVALLLKHGANHEEIG